MSEIKLRPEPLTRGAFAPFGDVIEAVAGGAAAMNEARFERFGDLCEIDVPGGRAAVSIARCRMPSSLPYTFDTVERHPHGSQAFFPLAEFPFVVVVAPPDETVTAADLRAFVTNGRQGINYRRGTWHMPLIAFEAGQAFLVVDRAAGEPNCEERRLDRPITLPAP